jgi:hypothetical protein
VEKQPFHNARSSSLACRPTTFVLPRSLKKNYPFGNNHRKKFSSSIGNDGRDDYRIHLITVYYQRDEY